MKFAYFASAACILADATHAQLATAPKRHLRQLELNDVGAEMSYSTTPTDASMKSESTQFMIGPESTQFVPVGGDAKAKSDANIKGPSSKSGKGGKIVKGGNGDKVGDLVAIITPLHGVHGVHGVLTSPSAKPYGTVSVNFNMDGKFLVSLDAAGLPTGGGDVLITSCMTCDFTNIMECPDETIEEKYPYTVYDEVFSNSAFRSSYSSSFEANAGQAVIVTDVEDEIIGCGLLGESNGDWSLKAEMGSYPGYTGEITASGSVLVTYNPDGVFLFAYNLGGLEANCVGCGIHIHAGTSCETMDEVQGHGWNTVAVQDLWTAAGGATYATDEVGNANGYFNMYNGYSYGKNIGHAVVVHGQNGERLACGVLKAQVHD